MFAQWILQNEYGIDTANVDINKVPEELINEYEKLRNKEGFIQISLEKDFKLLKECNHPAGISYFNNDRLRGLLNKRNNSRLAHGLIPIGKEDCLSLLNEIRIFIKVGISNFDTICKELQFPWINNDDFFKISKT